MLRFGRLYIRLFLTFRSLRKLHPKGMAMTEEPPCLYRISKHSLLASSIPLPLSETLLGLYSFTLSFHPTTGLPRLTISFICTCFTNSSSYQYDQTTSKFFFSSIPLHHTSLHLHKFPRHTFHTHFHCFHSSFHLVTPHAALGLLISTAHTLGCCGLFHVQVSDPYINVGRRILFLNPLFTSIDTFLPHNPCMWPYDTPALHNPLLYPLLSLCLYSTSQMLKLSLPPFFLLNNIQTTLITNVSEIVVSRRRGRPAVR